MRLPAARLTAPLVAAALAAAPVSARATALGPASTASAARWDTTFEPSAVATYVGDGKPNVMVVSGNASAPEAALALRRAIKSSGSAGVVMDDSAIGSVEGLDDAAIIERAKPQPVERVAVVRVFEGGDDEPPDVVVTFYQKDGAVTTALTGAAGVAVSPYSGAGSSGVNEDAAAAVSELTEATEAEAKSEAESAESEAEQLQRRYDTSYLWLEDWIGVSAKSGAVVARWSVIKQGKYGADLSPVQFFKIIERDDLVEQYRRRLAIRLGVGLSLIIGGVAMTATGMGLFLSRSEPKRLDFGVDDPLQMGPEQAPGWQGVSEDGALVIAGVGAGLSIVGALFITFFRHNPINRSEAAELIDSYNWRLKKRLGIDKKQAHLQLRASLGGYSGLTLSGRF